MMRINSKFPGYVQIKLRNLPVRGNNPIRRLATEPQAPPRRSRLGLYTVGTIFLAGGGALVYAKYDNDFRNQIVEYVPYLEDVLKSIYQEEKPYSESISSMLGMGPEAATDQRAPSTLPSNPVEKPAKKSPTTFRSVLSVEDLQEIEKNISNTALSVSESYKSIGNLLQEHAKHVSNILDKCHEYLDPNLSREVRDKTAKLSKALSDEEARVKVLQERINELRLKIRDSKLEGPKDLIELSKRRIDQSIATMKDASSLVNEDRSIKLLADKTLEKLEKSRSTFMEELHTLFPSLDIPKNELLIDTPEVDLFLLYSYMQVKMYENALNQLELNHSKKIKRALSSMTSSDDDPDRIGNMVADRVISMKDEMDTEHRRKIRDLKAECESEIAKQLARATEAHLLVVRDLEKKQEEKIVEKQIVALNDVVKSTQAKNQKMLSEMREQLKDIEDLVRSRSDKDYGAHRAQILWSACHSVIRSLRRLEPLKNYDEKIVSIKEEVDAITSASLESDMLVASVMRGIPSDAIERGVFTEEALIERFKKVEKVAKGLALIPEKGGSLPLYLLSWIQSYLVTSVKDQTHTSKKLTQSVPADMNSIEILQEARYWIDRGDLLHALRYMNLLQGYSRRVAADWIKETRAHLETVQAAEAIMAHSISIGML